MFMIVYQKCNFKHAMNSLQVIDFKSNFRADRSVRRHLGCGEHDELLPKLSNFDCQWLHFVSR